MSVLPAGFGNSRGYQITKSLRCRASGSTYLSRTPVSIGNRRTLTWSGWVKRGSLDTDELFNCRFDAANYVEFMFNSSNQLQLWMRVANVDVGNVYTNAVFRDPSAHMHVVLAVDVTQGVGTDRVKMWVNGALQTLTFSATPTNQDYYINITSPHYIGAWAGVNNFDGYLSEINFIDGQALDPSYFGQQDANGVWVPKKYAGTYGTNGFYLDFKDGSSVTALGYDKSGNNNHWTVNGYSLTAGVTYDWMDDTPTNNYATLNPLQQAGATFSEANGKVTHSAATSGSLGAVALPTSGKWYWESTISQAGTTSAVGIVRDADRYYLSTGAGYGQTGGSYTYRENGVKRNNATDTAYGASYTTNDVIGVAYDADSGSLTFYKNGVSQGVAWSSGLTEVPYFPVFGASVSVANIQAINFGQRPFAYTPPSGFKALCTANLPAVSIPNPKKHFDVALWTGNDAASRSISGFAFSPDLLWIKPRSVSTNNGLVDRVRGNRLELISNNTNAEANEASGPDLGTNAFTLYNGRWNTSPITYVSWLWKADGAGSANSDGSIASTVSANVAAGFSIVAYTGTGANATVGHGLGVAPKMVIVKNRSSVTNWLVDHAALTNAYAFWLNATSAQTSYPTAFNSTKPTSSVFSLGTAAEGNGSGNSMVAYCFAEIPGYSKIGSYVGNGSTDGQFVYCGFRPRFLLIKKVSGTSNWSIIDTARDTYNVGDNPLLPNSANAESTSTSTSGAYLDVTSNGFKLRGNSSDINDSATTYIFAAFAEHPFGGTNVAPSPAR